MYKILYIILSVQGTSYLVAYPIDIPIKDLIINR